MGGSPARIVRSVVNIPRRVVQTVTGGGGSAPRREEIKDKFEAPKQTEPDKKTVTRKLSARRGRRGRIGQGLVGGQLAGGDTLTAYNPVRNPRDTRSKLGG